MRSKSTHATPLDDWKRSIETALGVTFRDTILIRQALTHSSFVNEAKIETTGDPGLESNERLEFLGDAVVGFVAADYLYARCPDMREGTLTRMRAAVIRKETLAAAAVKLRLGEHLALGRGEKSAGGNSKPAILAGAFEAVVAAVYLEHGLEPCRSFCLAQLADDFEQELLRRGSKDAKSTLQEWTQKRWQLTPVYVTTAEQGPEHNRTFTIDVHVGDRVLGTGKGNSKQAAQLDAAAQAMVLLQSEEQASAIE